MSKQALLYFFPTKERLYGEVLARLAERLSSKIDDIDAPTPEQRLVTYFEAHTNGALSRPDDARLVIRVLLDTDAATKVSPLKPYLEKLVAVTRETNRWKDVSREEVLAGLYKLIGAIQYFAISTPHSEECTAPLRRRASPPISLNNQKRQSGILLTVANYTSSPAAEVGLPR